MSFMTNLRSTLIELGFVDLNGVIKMLALQIIQNCIN